MGRSMVFSGRSARAAWLTQLAAAGALLTFARPAMGQFSGPLVPLNQRPLAATVAPGQPVVPSTIAPVRSRRGKDIGSKTLTTSLGRQQTVYLGEGGVVNKVSISSPYVGTPLGYRTRSTRHFGPTGGISGYSDTTIHASGFGVSLHYDQFGKWTGVTITDWLGRRHDYDTQGRSLGESYTILALVEQAQDHPPPPRDDGIGRVPRPDLSSVVVEAIDLGPLNAWIGVTVIKFRPTRDSRVRHYDVNGVRTGSTDMAAAHAAGRGYTRFHAEHYDAAGFQTAYSKITATPVSTRQSYSVEMNGRFSAMSFSTASGKTFRYDPAGNLVGTGQ